MNPVSVLPCTLSVLLSREQTPFPERWSGGIGVLSTDRLLVSQRGWCAGAEASSTRVLGIFSMWSAGTSDGLGDRNESFISPFGRSRLEDEAFKKTVMSRTCSNDWSMCRRALRTNKLKLTEPRGVFCLFFPPWWHVCGRQNKRGAAEKKNWLFFLVFFKQFLCVSFYIWPGRFKR